MDLISVSWVRKHTRTLTRRHSTGSHSFHRRADMSNKRTEARVREPRFESRRAPKIKEATRDTSGECLRRSCDLPTRAAGLVKRCACALSLSPTSSCVLAPQRREPQSCLLPPGGGSPCDTLPHDGPAARLSRANLCPCPVSADLLCDDPGSSSSQPRALALLLEEQIHSDERARPRPTWTVRSPLSP